MRETGTTRVMTSHAVEAEGYDTALHAAVREAPVIERAFLCRRRCAHVPQAAGNHLDVLQFLVEEEHINVEFQQHDMETAVHAAARRAPRRTATCAMEPHDAGRAQRGRADRAALPRGGGGRRRARAEPAWSPAHSRGRACAAHGQRQAPLRGPWPTAARRRVRADVARGHMQVMRYLVEQHGIDPNVASSGNKCARRALGHRLSLRTEAIARCAARRATPFFGAVAPPRPPLDMVRFLVNEFKARRARTPA